MALANLTRFPKRGFSITASDTVKFPRPTSVYVGTGGTVAVVPWNPPAGVTSLVFKNVPNAFTIPILVEQVLSTGTVAATDLIGIYE